MKTLLDVMGPMLEGRLPVEEAAAQLGVSKNLAIYQRFCAAHRNTALAHVFVYCKEVLGERWPAVVEAYFRAHPMHHVEINANGASFAEFLKPEGWLSELADFEWWEWQTRVAKGQEQGKLGRTVEIRPYRYDFVDWDRAHTPPQRDTLIVFWRDRNDQPRREKLNATELAAIKAAYAGQEVDAPDLVAAGILLLILTLLLAADLQARIDTSHLPTLRVELTLAAPAERLCANIIGGGRGIKGLQAKADDPDCFEPASAYHVDLKALDNDNPDFAASMDGNWLWNDQAVILRPEPLPKPFTTEVTVSGPHGIYSVWPKRHGTYVADAGALDGGSYWALGNLVTLPPLNVAGREVPLFKVPRSAKANDAQLRAWVERALGAVASFHGMLPAERMLVFLGATRASSSAGVFGTIMRRHWATALLLYGARAEPDDFASDWMAVHELFHSVMPHVRTRPAWLIEGFTTYYQDVLRARTGMQSAQAMWDDLHDGVVRFCQPQRGRSLGEESDNLRQWHNYQRVYWGGACVAWRLDVAIRARSDNRHSLDTVLKQAWQDSMRAPLEPEEMIARLDAAAGEDLTHALLSDTHKTDFTPFYASLGLRVRDKEHVELLMAAPLLHVREAIMTNAKR